MDLYRENLLDHYKNPHNHGKLASADIEHHEFNASCGDDVTIYVQFDEKKEKVAKIAFVGKGCAISQAGTSMLTDYVKGKRLAELHEISKEDIFAMIGTEVGPGRLKCALMGLKTLMKGVEKWEAEHGLAHATRGGSHDGEE